MDRKLRKILTECIRDIETGARDVEDCLQRHADRAAELRPHLELWSGLDAADKAEPDIGSQQRGQHQLLTTLSEVERGGRKRMIPFLTPALVKAGAVAVAAVLVIGGTAGASAALGGPNVPGEVLSGIGMNDTSDPDGDQEMDREQERERETERASEGPGDPDEPIDNTPEAHREQEMERDREMEKASEGPGDPDEPIDHTPEANRQQEMESQQEMERTSEGPGEPNDSVDHTPEAHQEQEMESEQTMEGPFEGSGNANDPHRHASGPGPAY